MKCQICETNPATGSAIVNGVYLKNVCEDCKAIPHVNSGHARWSRTIDGEDHEADIQQPYQSDGSPNPKFAKLYPRQAKQLFTKGEIRKASL